MKYEPACTVGVCRSSTRAAPANIRTRSLFMTISSLWRPANGPSFAANAYAIRGPVRMYVSGEVLVRHRSPVAGAVLIRNTEMAARSPTHTIVEYELAWIDSDLRYRPGQHILNVVPNLVTVIA